MTDRYVYFIRPIGMDGPIKIGCSEVPVMRLHSLSEWSPFALEVVVTVPGDFALERRLHNRFYEYRSHREWFHPGPDLLACIERLKAGVSVERATDLNAPTGQMRPTWTKSPERSACISYAARLRLAARKLGKGAGFAYFTEPDDVKRIVDSARSFDRRMGRSSYRAFTAAELQRLEEVLAEPEAHFVRKPMSRAGHFLPAAASTEAA